ncbi:penicillin-binding protein [Ileibacterium valens]|uniref:penicillin-binding protein n=1 Tax=Ileibacterium valens TaxID=1862668 RepID=UPI00257238E4|nr:penicillin-binding protein [Ileibacterium valens]
MRRSRNKPQRKETMQKRLEKSRYANQNLISIFIVAMCCFGLVVANILYTMISKKHIWSQHEVITSDIASSIQTPTIYGKRGTIYDRNHQVLAQETVAYTLIAQFDNRTEQEKKEDEEQQEKLDDMAVRYALQNGTYDEVVKELEEEKNERELLYVKEAGEFAKSLKEVLGDSIDETTIADLVKNGMENGYAQSELGTGTKRLDKSIMEALKEKKIPGLGFIETTKRSYPTSPFSSNLIGYATYSEDSGRISGINGLEKDMNSYLAGKDGQEQFQQSKRGEILPGTHRILSQAEDGSDLVLTLDSNLQRIVEEEMQITMDTNGAESAWCVVMEVETGKILAWASYPTFNQNTPLEIPSYTDNVSEMNYEAGSVMKPFVYASAIDAGVYPYNQLYRAGQFDYTVDPGTGEIIRLENGAVTGYPTIKDALGKDFGVLSFEDGLANSSNIAICELLANYLDVKTYENYLDKFGFFKATDIPFVPETSGAKNMSDATSYLSTGFGQASSITVLQLMQAYSAIFNDGVMMKPYVVESIVDSATGQTINKFEPEAAGTPISADAANQTKDIMRQVFAPGFSGEKFAMEDVDLTGKTGTGERYDPETGTYDTSVFTSSIMAAAPADDPKIMVYWGMVSSNYINYSAEPFQVIMQQALIANSVNGGTSDSANEPYGQWESYEMPSLVNHSIDYANNKMADKHVNTVIIGDGSSIIDQFPKAGGTINSNDNVLLLTDGQSLTMPDLIGWTRKDLTALWQLSGLPIRQDGYGKVVWQSIPAGEPIQADTEIEVSLE